MKANKVKKDSTIGIFSSSSPVSATVPVRYNRGKEYLTNKGFHIIDGALYGKFKSVPMNLTSFYTMKK